VDIALIFRAIASCSTKGNRAATGVIYQNGAIGVTIHLKPRGISRLQAAKRPPPEGDGRRRWNWWCDFFDAKFAKMANFGIRQSKP
jgi:hypothetical protein